MTNHCTGYFSQHTWRKVSACAESADSNGVCRVNPTHAVDLVTERLLVVLGHRPTVEFVNG